MIHGIDSMHYGVRVDTQHARRMIYEKNRGCNWRAPRDVFVADVFRDKTRLPARLSPGGDLRGIDVFKSPQGGKAN